LRTRRIVVLAVLLVLCAISLAPHVRLYVEQERHQAAVQADIAAREAAVADLQRQQELWSDDAYIAAQARERLHYAFPGETTYVVMPPAAATQPVPLSPAQAETPVEAPWYRELWEGLRG